ncbi:DUF305 domain-containing protein [Psychromonas sp.]|uniref:DUF305 domain-containing protein n=1 Tax=Psychromonas sp. TaxID=1884585 RepID=UPI0035627423
MNVVMKKLLSLLSLLTVLFIFSFSNQSISDEQGHGTSEHMEHKSTSPGMIHMSHADMINSEQDFLREMIPHHQEAVDTSILLFVFTDDKELKMLTEAIYTSQSKEILDMRLSYARWYNLIPTGASYQPMMRDLNLITDQERETRYVQDMIVHHKGALDMAEKVLTLDGIHEETVIFAKHILESQQLEIELMQRWLKGAEASQ